MTKPDGTLTTTDVENAAIFKTYFTNMYNTGERQNFNYNVLKYLPQYPVIVTAGRPLENEEIVRAIRTMANGTAPGNVGPSIEAYKAMVIKPEKAAETATHLELEKISKEEEWRLIEKNAKMESDNYVRHHFTNSNPADTKKKADYLAEQIRLIGKTIRSRSSKLESRNANA